MRFTPSDVIFLISQVTIVGARVQRPTWLYGTCRTESSHDKKSSYFWGNLENFCNIRVQENFANLTTYFLFYSSYTLPWSTDNRTLALLLYFPQSNR